MSIFTPIFGTDTTLQTIYRQQGIYNFTNTSVLPSEFSFIRSSTATYFNSQGILSYAAINTPRFNYDPLTKTSKGLLFEGLRTNLCLYSEDLSNVVWTKVGSPVVTTNTDIAPNNLKSANLFTRTVTANSYLRQDFVKAASALTYTFSIFVKKNVGNYFSMRMQGTYPSRVDVSFNLNTGTISTAASISSSFTNPSAKITNIGKGWFICSVTATSDAASNFNVLCSPSSIDIQVDGVDSVSNSSCYVWGGQLEQNPFYSSYIPTSGTATTRGADLCLMSDLTKINFNSNEGTFYLNSDCLNILTFNAALSIGNGTTSNEFYFTSNSSTYGGIQPFSSITLNGFNTYGISGSSSVGVPIKMAASYNNKGYIFNGGGGTTFSYQNNSVVALIPNTFNLLRLGTRNDGSASGNIFGHIKEFQYYPYSMTSNQIQLLTT